MSRKEHPSVWMVGAQERGASPPRLAACGGEDRLTPTPPPPPPATREECWVQDVDYLASELAVDETIADLRAGRDPLLAAVADHR
jgi:hypothetical protein